MRIEIASLHLTPIDIASLHRTPTGIAPSLH
jgi:hypothetical protein